MLNVLGWLIVGLLIGWLGSVGVRSDRSRQLNLVAAAIGAMLGGMWFGWADLETLMSSSAISLSGLFIACLGAISVLTITNVSQHGRDLAPASVKVRRTPDGTASPGEAYR